MFERLVLWQFFYHRFNCQLFVRDSALDEQKAMLEEERMKVVAMRGAIVES